MLFDAVDQAAHSLGFFCGFVATAILNAARPFSLFVF